MHKVFKDKGDSLTGNMERMLEWYKRGAIELDEMLYQMSNMEKTLEFEELADLFIGILEDYTKKEKRDTRQKLLEIIIKRRQK